MMMRWLLIILIVMLVVLMGCTPDPSEPGDTVIVIEYESCLFPNTTYRHTDVTVEYHERFTRVIYSITTNEYVRDYPVGGEQPRCFDPK